METPTSTGGKPPVLPQGAGTIGAPAPAASQPATPSAPAAQGTGQGAAPAPKALPAPCTPCAPSTGAGWAVLPKGNWPGKAPWAMPKRGIAPAAAAKAIAAIKAGKGGAKYPAQVAAAQSAAGFSAAQYAALYAGYKGVPSQGPLNAANAKPCYTNAVATACGVARALGKDAQVYVLLPVGPKGPQYHKGAARVAMPGPGAGPWRSLARALAEEVAGPRRAGQRQHCHAPCS